MRVKVSTGFKIWGFITELVAYRIILGLCAAMVVLGCSLCFLRNQVGNVCLGYRVFLLRRRRWC